ncbi:SseB family protein [Rothia sp. LK2588]|uniref:SseB family protein n=1 Tax=Rothia sp. LK2588 TaxID=3114369 RepID=UPI0034CD3654
MSPKHPHNAHEASKPSQHRELPAHIQAQLASAGRATDTAGQPWAGRNLGEGTSHTHQFPADDGATEPPVSQALEHFAQGALSEAELVDALRDARIFTPVVAEVSNATITDEGLVSDKEADMAVVSIQAPDGRKALPVFTSVEHLTQWHPKARPVAANMRKAALAAVEDENQLMVLNPGADLTFVIRRPAVWAIARADEWIPSYGNERVQAELHRIVAEVDGVVAVRGESGQGVASSTADGRRLQGGGPGPELKIVLTLVPDLTQDQLNRVLGAVQQFLASSTVFSELVDSIQLALESA